MTRLLLLFLLMILQGCSKIKLDPYSAFSKVSCEINKRTNQNIYWRTDCEEDGEVEYFIQSMLVQELTADEAVQIALLNNRHLQAAYENLGISQADLVQAGLLKNPIFDLSYRPFIETGFDYKVDMGILQNFLDVLLKPLQIKLAKSLLDATVTNITTTVMEVALQTKLSFYHLQALQQEYKIIKNILLASEASWLFSEFLLETGNITQVEYSREFAFYEQSKIDVANAEALVLEAKEQLNVLLGLWGLNVEYKIKKKMNPIPKRVDCFDEIETAAIENSLDLRMARELMQATASQWGIEKSITIFPVLEAGAFAEREDGGAWSVGPAFVSAVPIFDFGQARSAAGRAELMKQWNTYYALAVEIRSRSRQSRIKLLNAFRTGYYIQTILLPLKKEVTNETHLQNNAMQIGLIELLDTKKDELITELELIKSQYSYWTAKSELEMIYNGHLFKGGAMIW